MIVVYQTKYYCRHRVNAEQTGILVSGGGGKDNIVYCEERKGDK